MMFLRDGLAFAPTHLPATLRAFNTRTDLGFLVLTCRPHLRLGKSTGPIARNAFAAAL